MAQQILDAAKIAACRQKVGGEGVAQGVGGGRGAETKAVAQAAHHCLSLGGIEAGAPHPDKKR